MSLQEQLQSLNQVASMASKDHSLYNQYFPALLDLGNRTEPELHTWLADFILSTLASSLEVSVRRELALKSLDTIVKLLSTSSPNQQPNPTLKATVLAAAMVYPLGFGAVCFNPKLEAEWHKLTAIKDQVTQVWGANPGQDVEIACIKFAQQLVLVQSRGGGAQSAVQDPRLAARQARENSSASAKSSDTNLGHVPSNHPLIHRSLEAEGQGVLDRLLGNLTGDQLSSDDHKLAETVFTSTVFVLAPIIRQRPEYAGRILQTVLMVDPVTMSSKFSSKLAIRFCEKSLKMLVTHCLRNKIHAPLRHRMERFLAEVGKKRPAPVEESNNKRVKVEEDKSTPTPPPPPPPVENHVTNVSMTTTMPPNTDSYSALFTLIPANDPLAVFDARTLPQQLALQIALTGLLTVDDTVLRSRVSVIKQRWENYQKSFNEQHNRQDVAKADPEDEFKSEALTVVPRDSSMDVNEAFDSESDEEYSSDASHTDFSGTFQLPPPPELSEADKLAAGNEIVSRLISHKDISVATGKAQEIKTNAISKLAINEWAGGSWMVILSRLLSRGLAYDPTTEPKDSIRVQLATHIRNQLLTMATTGFTTNFDDIMTWLNEEWYSELIRYGHVDPSTSTYYEYVNRIMDTLVQTIDPDNWKYFIRLMGELPELDHELVKKLKLLLVDPDRSVIGVRSLKYLIMLRPPTRDYCLDVIEDIYKENESLRGTFKQILQKHRPLAIEAN